MLKNFRVTVNGSTYDVLVEEVAADTVPQASPVVSAPVPAPAPSPAATPAPAPTITAAPGQGQKVTSPMPGTILDITVSAGQKVEKNQVVAILEAMKMENEIVTPYAGTVVSVNTSKGSAVNSGDLLLIVG